jgi:hypothetical protein
MKTFRVHFSFYSEECGKFDDSVFNVNAENVFEARRQAWLLCDTNDDMKFTSCVRQCGVTWDASPLDVQDYFNAQAADCKWRLKMIENIDLPNAKIERSEAKEGYAKNERSYYLGSLSVINEIARDFGQAHGLKPPSAYEELEYAWQFVSKFDQQGKHERADALAKIIERAEKWEALALRDLKELFDNGYACLCGDTVILSEYFSRDSVFPERADINEREYKYTLRWTNAQHIDKLPHFPLFDEKNVIAGSTEMPFEYKTLVLNADALKPEYRLAENMLWTPQLDNNGICPELDNDDPDAVFAAENLITGAVTEFRHSDFVGVLRPEYTDNIDFDALKSEYAETHSNVTQNDNNNEFDSGETPDDDYEREDE